MPEFQDTYYKASEPATTPSPSLEGQVSCDVCIIGGGFTGLSAALRLQHHGADVIVLEARNIGHGASGRNGGQLLNGYSCEYPGIKKRYGEQAAKDVMTYFQAGKDNVIELIKKHDIDCDLNTSGSFFAALTKPQLDDLEDYAAHTQPLYKDRALKLVYGDDVQTYINTDIYKGGVYDPHGAHIHPLKLLLGEAQAFRQNGGRLYENSEVISVTQGRPAIIKTKQGCVKAKHVIMAGNAYIKKRVFKQTDKVMPVSSQIMVTEPLGEDRAKALIPSGVCVADWTYVLDYYRLTADNRLLFGGGAIYGLGDPQNVEQRLRPNMLKKFPQLADVKIDYAWTGLIGITHSRMPHIGMAGEHIYFAQGYSGHGINVTHLSGQMLADAIYGKDRDTYDLFAGLKHLPFPGGRVFRVPLTNLAVLYYKLRDKFGF